MQIDMTKFINDYLKREGISPKVAQELRFKINEGLSGGSIVQFLSGKSFIQPLYLIWC